MIILSQHIFAHSPYPLLDNGVCAQHYLGMVSQAYCQSFRDQIDFVCPEPITVKVKVKRAQAGTLARGYRFLAQPSVEQETILNRIVGASRWVWNWALNVYLEHEAKQSKVKDEKDNAEENQEQEKGINKKAINKADNKKAIQDKTKTKTKISSQRSDTLSYIEVSSQLTKLKKTLVSKTKNGVVVQEKHWLNSIPDTVLRQTLMDLKQAWDAYENGQKGTRRDAPGKPKFKSKTNDCDSATFQVDARIENKNSCIDHVNHTIKIPGVDKLYNTLSFKQTETILGEISSFVISRKNNQYHVSLSMINISQDDIVKDKIETNTIDTQSKFVDFAYDNYPICSTLNPNKEGLIAIDMAAKWGGVATQNGNTTYQLISEEQRHRALEKEHNTTRYQRVQTRKIEAKYHEYGIKREPNGAWPKDAGKLLSEKVKERNDKHKEIRKQEVLKNTLLSITEQQEQIVDIDAQPDVFTVKSKRQINIEQQLSKKHTLKRNYLTNAIHHATTDIVRNNHTIVLETLNIKAMLEDDSKHSGFKKSIANTCLGEITRQLKYKAKWYGRNLIFVDTWFASSQLCSTKECSYKNEKLKLSDTHWTCPMCQTYHERNANASFNLWLQGWQLLEEFFQQNSTNNLADGSFVKGSQGVVEITISVAEHRRLRQATSKQKQQKQKQKVSPMVTRFQKIA